MKKTITLNESLDYNLIENQVRIMMRRDSSEEKVSTKGLRRSLEKIGDGEITEKSSYDYKGDRLMYKEMLNNDSLILVVHGAFKGTPYDKFDYGYRYDIGLYRNNPRSVQYGGGYGASGIIEIQHTQLLGYSDYDINHENENIISEVCNYIKSELVINENMKKTITLNESELISLIERMVKEIKPEELEEETGTASSGAYSTALDQQPIRRKIRTGLTKEEFFKLKEYMDMDESLSEGKKKTGTKLCARGKAAAKSKFKVYPSAYANGFAVQVCKGRMKGLDGQKKCSGSYC
jgi:hypothetical protein